MRYDLRDHAPRSPGRRPRLRPALILIPLAVGFALLLGGAASAKPGKFVGMEKLKKACEENDGRYMERGSYYHCYTKQGNHVSCSWATMFCWVTYCGEDGAKPCKTGDEKKSLLLGGTKAPSQQKLERAPVQLTPRSTPLMKRTPGARLR